MAHVRQVIVGGDLEHPGRIAPIPAHHHAVFGGQHALRRRERLRHHPLAGAVHDHLGHPHRAVHDHVRHPRLGRLEHPADQKAEQRLVRRRDEVVFDRGESALRDKDETGVVVWAGQLLHSRSPQHRLVGGEGLAGEARFPRPGRVPRGRARERPVSGHGRPHGIPGTRVCMAWPQHKVGPVRTGRWGDVAVMLQSQARQ